MRMQRDAKKNTMKNIRRATGRDVLYWASYQAGLIDDAEPTEFLRDQQSSVGQYRKAGWLVRLCDEFDSEGLYVGANHSSGK